MLRIVLALIACISLNSIITSRSIYTIACRHRPVHYRSRVISRRQTTSNRNFVCGQHKPHQSDNGACAFGRTWSATTARRNTNTSTNRSIVPPESLSSMSRFHESPTVRALSSKGGGAGDADPIPPPTFASYLSRVKDSMNLHDDDNDQILNPIIGNEAGDADSIISSLALAYVNSIAEIDRPVPIVSIRREDMPLRRDVVNLLTLAGIDPHRDLVYLDDPSARSILADNGDYDNDGKQQHTAPQNHHRITLVDHNKLRPDLWHLHRDVFEILDHHEDEKHHTTASTRNIAFANHAATVGSTCTLIVERLRSFLDAVPQSEAAAPVVVDPSVGLALLGVILLDTMDMDEGAGKGTVRDGEAIRFLLERTDWSRLCVHGGGGGDGEAGLDLVRGRVLGVGGGECADANGNATTTGVRPDRTALYEYLRDSKFDPSFWNGMNARDALRIDYKRFEKTDGQRHGEKEQDTEEAGAGGAFGLSSVLLPITSLIHKDGFGSAALAYMEETNVDLLGVLSFVMVPNEESTGGNGDGDENGPLHPSASLPRREILVIGRKQMVADVVRYLVGDPSALCLEIKVSEEEKVFALDDGWDYKRLVQGNPKGSRKQVAPIIKNFFK